MYNMSRHACRWIWTRVHITETSRPSSGFLSQRMHWISEVPVLGSRNEQLRVSRHPVLWQLPPLTPTSYHIFSLFPFLICVCVCVCVWWSRCSAIGRATFYGLDDWWEGFLVPVGFSVFSSLQLPDLIWGPFRILPVGTGRLFPWE
jgi:hypothetical protein